MSTSLKRKFDVVALSAACVDITMKQDDAFLDEHGIKKSLSTLVSAQKLAEILENKEDVCIKTSGSPGGNVATGIALRGGSSALIGKVANDDHGKFFAERVKQNDVHYTALIEDDAGVKTTCVAAVITPDKERSFAFSGDASTRLAMTDIDKDLLGDAKITYIDSFLWLSETSKEAAFHAAKVASASGSKVALSLNNADLVEKNRDEFLELALQYADILVGDRRELMKLFDTDNIEDAVEITRMLGFTASVTAGKNDVYVIEKGKVYRVPVQKIENVVDTSGAGDQFAAGFLYGLSQGKTAEESAKIGTQWAADIIQHEGAEPRVGKNAPKP